MRDSRRRRRHRAHRGWRHSRPSDTWRTRNWNRCARRGWQCRKCSHRRCRGRCCCTRGWCVRDLRRGHRRRGRCQVRPNTGRWRGQGRIGATWRPRCHGRVVLLHLRRRLDRACGDWRCRGRCCRTRRGHVRARCDGRNRRRRWRCRSNTGRRCGRRRIGAAWWQRSHGRARLLHLRRRYRAGRFRLRDDRPQKLRGHRNRCRCGLRGACRDVGRCGHSHARRGIRTRRRCAARRACHGHFCRLRNRQCSWHTCVRCRDGCCGFGCMDIAHRRYLRSRRSCSLARTSRRCRLVVSRVLGLGSGASGSWCDIRRRAPLLLWRTP